MSGERHLVPREPEKITENVNNLRFGKRSLNFVALILHSLLLEGRATAFFYLPQSPLFTGKFRMIKTRIRLTAPKPSHFSDYGQMNWPPYCESQSRANALLSNMEY